MKRTIHVASALLASLMLVLPSVTARAEAEEAGPRTCGPLPDAPVRGKAWAIDGGALSLTTTSGRRLIVRLWGIETPPLRDAATRIEHVPGVQARYALDERLRQASRDATCAPVEWDRACRLVAICEAQGNDLAGRLLVEGYALLRTHQALGKTSPELGQRYAETEERARDKRAGLWLGWLGSRRP
jgi:endonuclease YncB( thermonuclease family)